MLAARAAKNRPTPSHGGDLLEVNTLVRRLDEPDWHIVRSVKGQKIMAEWRDWPGPAGERPLVSAP